MTSWPGPGGNELRPVGTRLQIYGLCAGDEWREDRIDDSRFDGRVAIVAGARRGIGLSMPGYWHHVARTWSSMTGAWVSTEAAVMANEPDGLLKR